MNKELAKIFYEMADMLSAEGIDFKPFAYRRAARSLDDLQVDAAEIYAAGGLRAVEDISGVGKSIGQKIEEYVLRGKIDEYERLKRRLPVNLSEIAAVEGLGPKKAKVLYEKLGVKNLAGLEIAARAGKISSLFGFGEKSQENILKGVEFQKRSLGRFLLADVLPVAVKIKERLRKFDKSARIEIAGSLRRRRETIGDIDLLAALDSGPESAAAARLTDFFVAMAEVEKVWAKGSTKSSVRTIAGFDIDLRIVRKESFGAAWQYFTGSKDHNIVLRRIAKEMGYKLSEYGLFAGKRVVAGAGEEEIYGKLGLGWIFPELRENLGEIEAAQSGRLPEIIGYKSLRGDLHCHSDWNGGKNSIKEIAAAARAAGYEYAGIADHTKFLKIENGLDEKQLARRNKSIDKLNAPNGKFTILKGCEANIMADGSIDISNEALADLDFSIAGIHSSLKMNKKQMTKRVIAAINNPYVDIISHPTGRLLKRRPAYEIDFAAVCAAAAETGTILEINAFPERLDLNDRHIRVAKGRGVKMIVNTDSHHISHLKFAEFGLAQARRGWAEPDDIVNVWPWKKAKMFLKRNKKRVD